MRESRPAVLLYCEVNRGLGHWVRTATIAKGFSKRFQTVLVCTGDFRDDIEIPPDIELVRFQRGAHYPSPTKKSGWGTDLIELLARVRPQAILIEYFPFGRTQSAVYLVPFLRAARTMQPSPLILSSVRDIQEQCLMEQEKFDRRVVQTVNRLYDGVLVHSDPQLIQLQETFALASQLQKPVLHTGFVTAQMPLPLRRTTDAENTCLISVGGGGGGESVLRVAVHCAKLGLFPSDMTVHVAAGSLIPEEVWQELVQETAGLPQFKLTRWLPNMKDEMRKACVSVSRCGYNTALDLMATGVRALVIPFVETEEDEQTYRARKMEALGLVRVLEEGYLTPERLATEVAATRTFEPRRLNVDMEGAGRTVDLVEAMVEQRKRELAETASSAERQSFPPGKAPCASLSASLPPID
jgi:predicted glycosyltransferase